MANGDDIQDRLVTLKSTPILPIPGIRLASAAARIKKTPGQKTPTPDMVLMELAEGSRTAAVFTQNAFCAAPVILARGHLQITAPRYLLINSGNANAGTGEAGLADARTCCEWVAAVFGVSVESVLPFSTGVIGERLPMEQLRAPIESLSRSLREEAWMEAAAAIMTTDTRPKVASREVVLDDRPLRVMGMAKGAGMIRPDMATMLAFIATDAKVKSRDLQFCLEEAVASSFNCITVDGDTSTNDACVLIATGQARGRELKPGTVHWDAFAQAVTEVSVELAQAIIRDAEGATKFVTLQVVGGKDLAECREVAYTLAHSPLVKTALYASDPNWGRILAAVGRARVPGLRAEEISITLGEVDIVTRGEPAPDYTEEKGQTAMSQGDIAVKISLGRGAAQATIWTSDLSHEYVTINAAYRT
jgi:glutamate N-acetyltransferase/amino-acid N-acetyltransferase